MRVVSVRGSFDQALNLVRTLAQEQPVALVNSVNPYRIEGQKTAAFEVVDDLGDAPDYLCIPVGNAGNITAYWKGFCEYREVGQASGRPRMMGFQAAGAAPLVHGTPVEDPQTVASAIRIGNPASWDGAIRARDESGGAIDSVTDEEILDAYRALARQEGIFCEPASAASLAGLAKLVREGADLRGKSVVCILTGTGLKDPEAAEGAGAAPRARGAAGPGRRGAGGAGALTTIAGARPPETRYNGATVPLLSGGPCPSSTPLKTS